MGRWMVGLVIGRSKEWPGEGMHVWTDGWVGGRIGRRPKVLTDGLLDGCTTR
jgi:hypothetical protein